MLLSEVVLALQKGEWHDLGVEFVGKGLIWG